MRQGYEDLVGHKVQFGQPDEDVFQPFDEEVGGLLEATEVWLLVHGAVVAQQAVVDGRGVHPLGDDHLGETGLQVV